MLLPADRVLEAMDIEFQHLDSSGAGAGQGNLQQSLGVALKLLRHREREGANAVLRQLASLKDALTPLAGSLTNFPELLHEFAALTGRIDTLLDTQNGPSLESNWSGVLAQTEKLAHHVGRDRQIPNDVRIQLTQAMTAWETVDLKDQLSHEADTKDQVLELDATSLQAYLQQRFSEPALSVTRFNSLAGGFGKQTFLFDVTGQALNGSFVMRRDSRVPLLEHGCHRVFREFKVIRAAFDRGFPAPEALWVDTEHDLLPGGDFLIMKRSPGESGGSVFAAQGEVPQDLAKTLASILARLHKLPPMTELSTASESISSERWALPLSDCVHRYLTDWFQTFLDQPHLPSPAIVSQFSWLLDNVPQVDGTPVLLHGDIGFHNFLFEKGQLVAVLDWEFAHLGDPAEDLAYVRNTLGTALDWPAFMAAYKAEGGYEVDEKRLQFFQVWGHLRNAASANIAAAKFADGQADDLKMVILPHLYIPLFLNTAQTLIDQAESGAK